MSFSLSRSIGLALLVGITAGGCSSGDGTSTESASVGGAKSPGGAEGGSAAAAGVLTTGGAGDAGNGLAGPGGSGLVALGGGGAGQGGTSVAAAGRASAGFGGAIGFSQGGTLAVGQGGSARGGASASDQGGSAQGGAGATAQGGAAATPGCVPGIQTGDSCDQTVDSGACVRSDRTCTCGTGDTWSCVSNVGTGGNAGADTGGASGIGGTTAEGGTVGGEGGAEGGAEGGSPATGGTGEGGAASGGSGSCDQSAPPSGVSAWIDESWDAQLGDNIRDREAWLLDKAIRGKGQINLCVRWGASSAPTDGEIAQMGDTIQRWLNDWFLALGTYDCFPYPSGVTVKVTGWAVKPGNEAFVEGRVGTIPIYTETDGDGEPICPSSCSTFDHWDYDVSGCPGGEAARTDYWIWLDDQLPGDGGAAAVGGDWGLRMPVAAFTSSMGSEGDFVIEHEMGHGFGFQDYYDWTGSRPDGGSLMIVGSATQGKPTEGDTWLVRRAWKEQKKIRGWD